MLVLEVPDNLSNHLYIRSRF